MTDTAKEIQHNLTQLWVMFKAASDMWGDDMDSMANSSIMLSTAAMRQKEVLESVLEFMISLKDQAETPAEKGCQPPDV